MQVNKKDTVATPHNGFWRGCTNNDGVLVGGGRGAAAESVAAELV